MVVPLLAEGFGRGLNDIPYIWIVAKVAVFAALVYFLKIYFGGARCRSERVMHGKVVIVTGGTSGIGAAVVKELATRGAQVILLTHHEPTDLFLVDYIDDLRSQCNNELIYAEQVDLTSLHSIRLFATKWVDNAPPRRLDMVIFCANTMTPRWGKSRTTVDGVEEEWMLNYLSTFHLLSILSPALRAQPPDRDVRVIFSTCSSYIGAEWGLNKTESRTSSGGWSHGRSKLILMNFVYAFQKHLDAYTRPDKQPNNSRAVLVDPGYSRTPGMRRWLTGGTISGLALYLITWPLWWLALKSPEQGAQSYLYAAMDAEYGRSEGGRFIKECRNIEPLRSEAKNEDLAKDLWEFSEKQIERLEKQGAVKRALEKKERENMQTKSTTNSGTNTANGSASTASEKKQTTGSRRSKNSKG